LTTAHLAVRHKSTGRTNSVNAIWRFDSLHEFGEIFLSLSDHYMVDPKNITKKHRVMFFLILKKWAILKQSSLL
jgi:hypothetical protein